MQIVITRGKKKGEFYLKVSDNGEGIPRDGKGLPDFRHVATHICDSVKRRLKDKGAEGIQGEFGIGLLSFWTVGQNLSMTCCGADGSTYEMTMAKNSPGDIYLELYLSDPGSSNQVGLYRRGTRDIFRAFLMLRF